MGGGEDEDDDVEWTGGSEPFVGANVHCDMTGYMWAIVTGMRVETIAGVW